jgi:hypothetical protein
MEQKGIPQQFGEPPTQGGIARFIGMARNIALVPVALLAAEQILPAPYKPSQLIGRFVASVEISEITSKQNATAAYTATMAEAQAQGPIAIENNRQKQQRVADSMQTQVFASNVADLACLGGMAVKAFSGGNPDYQNVAHALGSACGMSQEFRRTMAQEQDDISGAPRSYETGDANRPGPPAAPVPTALPADPVIRPAEPVEAYAAPRPAAEVPAQRPVSAQHRMYQQIHFAEWQAKLGPERVRQLREAAGPYQTPEGFQEYLNLVEVAAKQTY